MPSPTQARRMMRTRMRRHMVEAIGYRCFATPRCREASAANALAREENPCNGESCCQNDRAHRNRAPFDRRAATEAGGQEQPGRDGKSQREPACGKNKKDVSHGANQAAATGDFASIALARNGPPLMAKSVPVALETFARPQTGARPHGSGSVARDGRRASRVVSVSLRTPAPRMGRFASRQIG